MARQKRDGGEQTTYQLYLPVQLHQKLKVIAAEKKVYIRDLIIAALEGVVSK